MALNLAQEIGQGQLQTGIYGGSSPSWNSPEGGDLFSQITSGIGNVVSAPGQALQSAIGSQGMADLAGIIGGVGAAGAGAGLLGLLGGGGGAAGGIGALPGEVGAGGISGLPSEAVGGALPNWGSAAAAQAPSAAATPDLISLGGTGLPTGGDTLTNLSDPSLVSGAGNAAAPAAGGGNSLTSMLGGAFKGINPLSALIGAGGLAYNMSQGQKALPSTNALKDASNQAATTSQNLTAAGQKELSTADQYQQYLTTGTLPPGMMQEVDQAIASKKASIISNYAASGMNANPQQNSSLAAELAAVDQQRSSMVAQLGQSLSQTGSQIAQTGTTLLSQGAQATGLQDQLLQMLAQIDQTQTANMGKAISNFAASLAPAKTVLNIGGSSLG